MKNLIYVISLILSLLVAACTGSSSQQSFDLANAKHLEKTDWDSM